MNALETNFLLLFLSNGSKKPSCYQINDENVMTEHSNESAVRELAVYLQERSQKIDKIFLFSSQATKKLLKNADMTTVDFFKSRIKEFVPAENIIIVDYDESNSMNAALSDIGEMGKSILAEAEKTQREKGAASHITIHADMTGGMRNASMMMLGVMRLLNFSGLQMGRILYSNWEPNRSFNFVEDSQDVYRFFDLVAGATEFAKYGSVEKLADYYNIDVFEQKPYTAECGLNRELYELVNAMGYFAQSIKLCRYGELEDACALLAQKIQAFTNLAPQNYDANDKLFSTLLPTIEESYKTVLSAHDDLDIITWCVKQGHLQQAMTLYTERVPEFIAKQGFYTLDAATAKEINKKVKNEEISAANYLLCVWGKDVDKREDIQVFFKRALKQPLALLKQYKTADDAEVEQQLENLQKDIDAQNYFITFDKDDFRKALSELKQIFANEITYQDIIGNNDGLAGLLKRYLAMDEEEGAWRNVDLTQHIAGNKQFKALLNKLFNSAKEEQLYRLFNIDKLPYRQLSRGYLLQCGMKEGKITSNLRDDAALVDIINSYTVIRMARNSSNHARHEKGASPREIEEKILSGIRELRKQAAYLKSKQAAKA